MKQKIICILLAMAVALSLTTDLTPAVEAAAYASDAEIQARIEEAKALWENKYWNGNKSPQKLTDAVDAQDLSDAAMGITSHACSGKKRDTGCTSNSFKYGGMGKGSQCNGFSKFMTYFLFGPEGDTTTWERYDGKEIAQIQLKPGDRVYSHYLNKNGYNSIHSAVVWKIEDGKIYFAEVWGSSGCKINFGHFAGSSRYTTYEEMMELLVSNSDNTVWSRPDNISLYNVQDMTGVKPTLSLSGQTVPNDQHKQGDNFGIRGTIRTDAGTIVMVQGAITTREGAVVQAASCQPNTKFHNLRDSINKELRFGQLPAGDYYYCIAASADNGGLSTTVQLLQAPFSVTGSGASAPTSPAPADSAPATPTLTLSGATSPNAQHKEGDNFGIRGTVSTDVGTITVVQASITNRWGSAYETSIHYPNAKTHDLRYSINNDLHFGELPVGDYIYGVSATAVNGDRTVTSLLLSVEFSVVSAGEPPTAVPVTPVPVPVTPVPVPITPPPTAAPAAPTIYLSGATYPDSTHTQGNNFGIRGTVSVDVGRIISVDGYIIDQSGAIVQHGYYAPHEASHDLRYSINNDLMFGQLSPGVYSYMVYVGAANGDAMTYKYVIDTCFTVTAPAAADSGSDIPLNSVSSWHMVDVGAGSTLRFCSTVSTADAYEIGSIPNGAYVFVFGTTTQQYENRTWAKIDYNGTVGWVNYKWLK